MKGLGAFHICILDRSEDAADMTSRWRRMVSYGAVVSPDVIDGVDVLAVVDPTSSVERQVITAALRASSPFLVPADELLSLADRGETIDERTVARLDADFRASYHREEDRAHRAFAAIATAIPALNHFRI